MASVTLATLVTRARQRADMVNSLFVTDAELANYLTASAQELHDLLVQKFGSDYSYSTSTVTTAAGTETYALPSTFYKLLAADITINSKKYDLKKYVLKERNHYKNSTLNYPSQVPRYRLQGSNISLLPAPSGVYTVTLHFAPVLPVTTNIIVAVDFPNGWEEYVVVDAAIKCLAKEESDTRDLMASKQMIRGNIDEAAENRDAGEPDSAVDVDVQDADEYALDFP